MVKAILWILTAFLMGSIPFAVWLGRLVGVDPRSTGDGNPGTFNVWKLAGWKIGVPVMLFDFFKGALPVAVAKYAWEWSGITLVAVSIAPVLGHVFSPFLSWRGGKGLATSFGVWTGLTLAEGPLILGATLTFGTKGLHWRDGWVIALGLLVLLLWLSWRGYIWELWLSWVLLGGILIWGYRTAFGWPPRKGDSSDA